MYYYIYYSYLAYNAYKYYYLVEYGYTSIKYLGKVYKWICPPKQEDMKDHDWVLCDIEDDPDIIIIEE